VGVVGGSIGRRAEVGGYGVDAIGGGVVGHGAGAAFGVQRLDCLVGGGGGVDNGENSLAAGGEGEFVPGAVGGGVGPVANGGGGEDFAGCGVQDRHFFAAADGEEAVAIRVEGESGWRFAGGPGSDDFVGVDVDFYDFIFVFDVVVDTSLPVGDGEFWLAGNRDGGDEFAGVAVDYGDVVAAAIKCPDGFGGGFPEDGVGIGAGGDGGGCGKGGAIEEHDGIASAVGDVARFSVGVEGNTVRTVKAADGAQKFAGGGVDGVHVVAAGDVDTMGGRVNKEVVPAAGVGETPVVEDLVGTLGGSSGGGQGDEGEKDSWS